jgi:hypothetical protein
VVDVQCLLRVAEFCTTGRTLSLRTVFCYNAIINGIKTVYFVTCSTLPLSSRFFTSVISKGCTEHFSVL